jgi:hypothetical protein
VVAVGASASAGAPELEELSCTLPWAELDGLCSAYATNEITTNADKNNLRSVRLGLKPVCVGRFAIQKSSLNSKRSTHIHTRFLDDSWRPSSRDLCFAQSPIDPADE